MLRLDGDGMFGAVAEADGVRKMTRSREAKPPAPTRPYAASAQQEARRVGRLLRRALSLLEVSNRTIEVRMGFSRHSGYLSRLFAGTRELRLCQILEILRAAGIPAASFFHVVFPQGAESGHVIEELLAAVIRDEAGAADPQGNVLHTFRIGQYTTRQEALQAAADLREREKLDTIIQRSREL